MKIKKPQKLSIIVFFVVVIVSYFLFFKNNKDLFYFISSLALVIGFLPFILDMVSKTSKEEENSQMFLEFSRDLVESVKSGTPIGKSIINLKTKSYGSLTKNIEKLANQIMLGNSVMKSFEVFSRDLNNPIINRAVMLISESEKAGGNIEDILESVSKSVGEIEKLKKERKSAIYNLVIEGYIIFFVFLVIMLIMEFSIIPMIGGMSLDIAVGPQSQQEHTQTTESSNDLEEISNILLYILLLQGFFSGLIVGKLAEGNIKAGVKHSFIMVTCALVIRLGAGIFIAT